MSIMDLFKPAKTPEAKAPAATPAADTKAADANANNPAKASENPLDAYQKLFDNAASNSDIQAPSFSIAPEVIADVAGKMDFMKGIDQELMQKALGGDAASVMAVLQQSNRNTYRASLEHATKLTDTHLGQRSEFEAKRVQRGVKDQLTSDALTQGKANLNHPLVKQELNNIARRFANSPEYADASPQEIAAAAHSYFQDLHNVMNPADPTKTKEGKAKAAEFDYVAYLTGASQGS